LCGKACLDVFRGRRRVCLVAPARRVGTSSTYIYSHQTQTRHLLPIYMCIYTSSNVCILWLAVDSGCSGNPDRSIRTQSVRMEAPGNGSNSFLLLACLPLKTPIINLRGKEPGAVSKEDGGRVQVIPGFYFFSSDPGVCFFPSRPARCDV